MASKTSYLGLGYFDYKDRLDTSISARVEAERFNIIDRQLYGLFSIFGDGIVSGMQAVIRQSAVTGSQVIEVQPGTVIIRGRSYTIDSAVEVTDISMSGEFYLYLSDSAVAQGERRLNFVFDRSSISNIGVRLCRVVAPYGDVSFVDNSVKQEISFKSVAQQEIANHRHSGSPSRIDLLREVKNALPGARVKSFDASKVSSGVVSKARIPRIDHSSLSNKGVLSHTELESMALHLSSFSRVLMSEVASRNLMQQSILLRRSFPLSSDQSVNMVTFVPGVSPSTMLDSDLTTAIYNPTSGCIAGAPRPVGRRIQIGYRSPQALQSGFQVENLQFINSAYVLTSSFGSSSGVQFKDSFENSSGGNLPIPGFTSGTEISSDAIKVVSNTANVTDGAFSANIFSGRKEKSVYKRVVASNKNWNAFNRLFVDVKCVSGEHPVVYVYFNANSGSDTVSSERFVILGQDEVTSGANSGFKTVELNIETYERTDVKEIVFEVEDASVDFSFIVDNVRTSSVESGNTVYSNYGFVRYRHNSSSLVFLNSIFYDIQNPASTRYEVRYRAGRTLAEMQSAEFSAPVGSGDYIGSISSFVEVEIRLYTNTDKSATPSFTGMDISLDVPEGRPEFLFDTESDWQTGTASAIDIKANDGGYIAIKDPLETGDLMYVQQDRLQQLMLIGGSYTPRRAWLGGNLFISPAAAMDASDSSPASSFDQPSRFVRTQERNVIISDTYNNRVLVLDETGKLIKGFGGAFFTNRQQGNVPLTAVYNDRTMILQIVFGFNIPETVNIDFISLKIGSSIVRLSTRDSVISSGYPKNVLAIKLASDRASLIASIPSGNKLLAKIDNSVFGSDFTFNKESPVYIYSHGVDGLDVFIGDFTFVPHIVHPVYANSNKSGEMYVANSTIFFDRLRAGLRDDTDEFFISPSVVTKFYVVANLDENTASLNPTVVFVNDQESASSAGLEGEDLIFKDASGTPMQGSVVLKQVGNLVGEVSVNPNVNDVNKTFLGKVKVRIFTGTGSSRTEIPSSPFFIEKRITVVELPSESGDPNVPNMPSLAHISGSDGTLIKSYGNNGTFTFSDFTLGGLYLDEDNNRIAVSGIFKLDSTVSPPPPNVDPTTFRGQAALLLKNYRGRMVEMTLDGFEYVRKYDSPDGLYCSDISIDNSSQYVIAESAIINASGRAIKLDSHNNITFVFGGGQFGVINSIFSTNDGTLIFST